MRRRKYLRYVAAVSDEILDSRRWTVELASMLSRKFAIKKSTAYKILWHIYCENRNKIERHRIGKNGMKISPNMLVWHCNESILKKYLDGQMTVRDFK